MRKVRLFFAYSIAGIAIALVLIAFVFGCIAAAVLGE